jgi:hypothetical protein
MRRRPVRSPTYTAVARTRARWLIACFAPKPTRGHEHQIIAKTERAARAAEPRKCSRASLALTPHTDPFTILTHITLGDLKGCYSPWIGGHHPGIFARRTSPISFTVPDGRGRPSSHHWANVLAVLGLRGAIIVPRIATTFWPTNQSAELPHRGGVALGRWLAADVDLFQKGSGPLTPNIAEGGLFLSKADMARIGCHFRV